MRYIEAVDHNMVCAVVDEENVFAGLYRDITGASAIVVRDLDSGYLVGRVDYPTQLAEMAQNTFLRDYLTARP